MRASKYREVCFVPRLIERCVLGFNLSHSADQTNSLLNSSLELYLHEIDLRYNIIRYITWLIPSLGFIGTVIGIMLALNYAGDRANVEAPDMLYQVTERLGCGVQHHPARPGDGRHPRVHSEPGPKQGGNCAEQGRPVLSG